MWSAVFAGPLTCGYKKDEYSVPLFVPLHTETVPIEFGRGDDRSDNRVQLYALHGILQPRFAVVSRCDSLLGVRVRGGLMRASPACRPVLPFLARLTSCALPSTASRWLHSE